MDLEDFLRDMGILPAETLQAPVVDAKDGRRITMNKNYFNDPRDENGEVNF